MRVTILGSGNTATVLGRKIFHSGHIIHQVFSRDINHATKLADQLSATPVNEFSGIDTNADMYIVALPDYITKQLGDHLQLRDKFVVHTAGSVSMEVLDEVSTNCGVLYPLQTLRKEIRDPFLPILIDANNEWNKIKLSGFAQSFADSVSIAGYEQRSKLHLAAVITNNFSNHLYALTEEFCSKEQVEFNLLLPLLEDTAKRLSEGSPADMQTGPAARNDETTIHKHKEMLREYPELLSFYEVFTQSIRKNK